MFPRGRWYTPAAAWGILQEFVHPLNTLLENPVLKQTSDAAKPWTVQLQYSHKPRTQKPKGIFC